MKRVLFIHIGTHKTGSTAIQSFLTLNKTTFEDHGVLYPGTRENHYFITKELREKEKPYLDMKTELFQNFQEIKKSLNICNKYIISSEGFCESDATLLPRLKDTLKFFEIDFEIKIIVFLRPQVSWLESSYQQIVKDLKARTIKSFDDYIKLDYLYDYCDYYSHLNLWANYFGKSNIVVIPYDPMQPKLKVFNDFLTAIDFSRRTKLHIPPPDKSNIGLSKSNIEFLRWLNIFGVDKIMFQDIIAIIGNIENDQYDSCGFMKKEKSDEIARFYEESNRLVALNFLKRHDGVLFPLKSIHKRSLCSEYFQYDIFMPELFVLQIKTIRNKNKKLLGDLYMQISKVITSDVDVKKSSQQFLALIESLLKFDKVL